MASQKAPKPPGASPGSRSKLFPLTKNLNDRKHSTVQTFVSPPQCSPIFIQQKFGCEMMNRHTNRLMTYALSLALSWAAVAQAENWPQWRGPRSDGKSVETALPTKFSKTEHVAWRTALPGQGGATPVIWDDRIFVTSAAGTTSCSFACRPKMVSNCGSKRSPVAIKMRVPVRATQLHHRRRRW